MQETFLMAVETFSLLLCLFYVQNILKYSIFINFRNWGECTKNYPLVYCSGQIGVGDKFYMLRRDGVTGFGESVALWPCQIGSLPSRSKLTRCKDGANLAYRRDGV